MNNAELLVKEINKGVAKANEYFKKNSIKAKAFNVNELVIYKTNNKGEL